MADGDQKNYVNIHIATDVKDVRLYANGLIEGDYEDFQKFVIHGPKSDLIPTISWFLLLQEWRRQQSASRKTIITETTPWEELIESARRGLLADLKLKE